MRFSKIRVFSWIILILLFFTGENSFATKIIVAGEANRPPLEYMDSTGEPRGIIVDLWKLWSEKTGVEVEYILLKGYEAFNRVREGTAHVLSAAIPGTDITLEYSSPYYYLDAHVFHSRTVRLDDPENLEAYRVGMVAGDLVGRFLRGKYPDFSIKPHTSFSHLIKEMEAGKIKLFVANPEEALFNMGRSGLLSDFRQSQKPLYSTGIAFGVRKGNFPLLGVISGGLEKITAEEKTAIERRYAGITGGHRFSWLVSGIGILASLVMGGGVAFWAFQGLLKKGVTRETEKLRKSHQLLLEFNGELKERETRHRAVSEGCFHAVFIIEKGSIIEAGNAGPGIFGWELCEMIGKDLENLIAPDSSAMIDRIMNASAHEVFTLTGIRKDRTTFPMEVRRGTVKYKGRALSALSFGDLTLPNLAEKIRNAGRTQYQTIIGALGDPVAVIDSACGSVLLVNDAFAEKTGYAMEDVVGKAFDDLNIFKESLKFQFLTSLTKERGDLSGMELLLHTVDATELPVLVSARPARFETGSCLLIIARDLTGIKDFTPEDHLYEEQLLSIRANGSMESLAGGFAESLDRILMEILGNISTLQVRTDPAHFNRKKFDHIEQLVRSGTRIATRLHRFEKEVEKELIPTDLNELVKAQAALFSRSNSTLKCFDRFEKAPWPVEIDRDLMEQALFDIFLNAVSSMPHGGNLEVRTQNVILNELFTEDFGAMPGRFVKISIEDSGMGMDTRKQAQLLAPFHTSRALGRGPGLGLAYARSIVKNHGGTLMVRSEMDTGTRVNIYLPAWDKNSSPRPLAPLALLPGRETVLLIEEEKGSRNMGAKLIASLGYNAVTQPTGINGTRRYIRDTEQIDLVIFGLSMSDMDGEKILDKLLETDPDVKSMVSIRHNVNFKVEELLAKGCRDFVRRPFAVKELSRKIRKVLDES